MVEKILDKLPKTKCVFPECSFKRADHQVVLDHQEDCCHRKAPCGNCGQEVAMSSLNEHLAAKHGRKLLTMVDQNWVWGMPFGQSGNCQYMIQGPRNTVALSGMTFYLNNMYLDENNIMIWVSYNGLTKDDEKYRFRLEVSNKDQKEVLSCTRFCIPCDTSRDIVREDNLGVIVNQNLAQRAERVDVNVQFFLAI